MKKRTKISCISRIAVPAAFFAAFLAAGLSHAQDATWLLNPGSSDWNTATNWTPATVPTGTATFDLSNTTTIGVSTTAAIGTLQFNAGAPAYSFNLSAILEITGNGIVNNSSNAPVFNTSNYAKFANSSTAANAIFNNSITGGSLFYDTSTAGTATINNNGGVTQFQQSSTAGAATITNNAGGQTEFFDSSSAGTATIITNFGAVTAFFGTSTGGQASLITNADGFVDLSFLTSGGMTVGSIAGAGTYYLGSVALTVGGNNTSTEVTGTINDGGQNPGTIGSSLIKVGTGTLTLTGINTYTGGTSFNGGIVAVDSDANLGTGALSFDGGALEALAAGGGIVSSKTMTLNAGGGTFLADSGTTSTLSGAISGVGSFTLEGPGTLILSGDNTYSGATNVASGTLQAGSSNALSAKSAFTVNSMLDLHGFNNTIGSLAGTGTVTNNGTSPATLLAGSDNTSTTFSGSLTDGTSSLGFTKAGAGTMILTGTNTYTGGTTISAGTLQLGDSETQGSIVGAVINDGTFEIVNANTSRVTAITTSSGGQTDFENTTTAASAAITNNAGGTTSFSNMSTAGNATITNDAGGLTQFLDSSSAGNATITTNNGGFTDFTGTSTGALARFITNAGGILDISGLNSGGMTAGSIEGAGTYRLGSKVLTVGLNNLSTEVSGTIEGGSASGGTLIKEGSGTLTLSGTNTYGGGTVLNAGTLTVNSAQALGLGNVVVNAGILNADPQPINVKGNYTQNARGILQLKVTGANPGQYDSLNVGGNATLGGTLQLFSLGFHPQAGNQLTLVTTGGTVTNRFAQFVDPFATGQGYNTVDLVYSLNSVVLEFLNLSPSVPPPSVVTIDFESFARTPNQRAAANILDNIQLNPAAADMMNFLYKQPVSNLLGDLDLISPDALTAFYEISFSNANIQRLNLEGRLDDVRAGSNGFNSNMKSNSATVNLEDKAPVDGKASPVEQALQPGPENRWGVWVTGFGDFVNVDADYNAKAYNFTTGGFSVGVDYRLTDYLAIGAMGEYSHTWTNLTPAGDIDVDSGRGGVYLTLFGHGFYFDGAIYGGHNVYSSSREALGGIANGGTSGAEFSTFVGGGYDWHAGSLTIGPIASLQYTYAGIDSFTEKGSLAPMAIHSQSAESLRTDFGFRASYNWQVGKVPVEPTLQVAWEHEYKYTDLPLIAGFAGDPSASDTFVGPNEGHDSAIISAGVTAYWTLTISTYIDYDDQLGRDRYNSNAVTGGVRISF